MGEVEVRDGAEEFLGVKAISSQGITVEKGGVGGVVGESEVEGDGVVGLVEISEKEAWAHEGGWGGFAVAFLDKVDAVGK